MLHHVKELQFNAQVSKPDPRFARLLLEQFGGPNSELKAILPESGIISWCFCNLLFLNYRAGCFKFIRCKN